MVTGYGKQYFSEFKADSYPGLSKIGPGSYYRLEFYFRGYNGQASELFGAETTITLSQNDKWIGIKTTESKISLVVQNNTTLQSFYVDDDRQVLVVLRKEINSTTYQNIFYGWLTPWDATEPYMRAPYQIDLTATCGLGSLQDFEYDYLPGIHTVHNILYNCLVKVGYELPLHQASYIYEESQLINGNLPNLEVDAFFTTKINTQGFIENGKRKSCYDILADFCEANYVLCQDGGVWKLVRREHQIDFAGQFAYLRYQDAADYNPTTIVTDIRKDVFFDDDLVPLNGATLGVQQGVKIVEVTAPYGELVNQLRNGFFTGGLNSWTLNTSNFGPVAGLIALPIAIGDGSENNPYALKVNGNAYNSAINNTSYLLGLWSFKQTVNVSRTVRPISTTRIGQPGPATNQERQVISLSIDFVNYYCSGPLVVVMVATDQGNYYLTKEGTFKKSITDGALTFDNTFRAQNGQLQAKPTKGETFTVTATEPVPGLGAYTLTVFFYQGISLETSLPNAAIEYRRAYLTIDDNSTIVAVKEIVTASPANLDVRSRKRKEDITIPFVDQTTWHGGAGLRYNALLRVDATPTLRWIMNTSAGPIRDKWQNHVARGYYRLNGKQASIFDGDVLGEPSSLELLRFPELDNKLMMPTQWEWNVNRRTTRVRAIELLNVLSNIKLKGQWESQDSIVFPMPEESTDFSGSTPPTVYIPRQNSGGQAGGNSGLLNSLQNSIALLVPNTAMQVPKDYVSTSKVVTSIRNSLTNAIIRYGGK